MRSHYTHRLIPVIIVGVALLIAALASSAAVGATAPFSPGATCNSGISMCQPGPYYGYAVNSTYVDPRYCGDGLVSVVRDPQYGELINVCSSTGQRIFPVSTGYYGAPPYLAPFTGGAAPLNGYRFTGSRCTIATCALPANGSGRIIGGIYYYNDSRFCANGKIGFVLGTGEYFCASSGRPIVG